MNPKCFLKTDYEQILGKNVVRLREHKNLSTKELAEEILGHPEEELIKLESGKYAKVRLSLIVDIAIYFKVSIFDLITVALFDN